MYKIIKNGELLAVVEQPFYIRKMDNGSFAPVSESQATGVAINSTPYQLFGRIPLDDGMEFETVLLSEVDGGTVMMEQNDQIRADVDFIAAMQGVSL